MGAKRLKPTEKDNLLLIRNSDIKTEYPSFYFVYVNFFYSELLVLNRRIYIFVINRHFRSDVFVVCNDELYQSTILRVLL